MRLRRSVFEAEEKRFWRDKELTFEANKMCFWGGGDTFFSGSGDTFETDGMCFLGRMGHTFVADETRFCCGGDVFSVPKSLQEPAEQYETVATSFLRRHYYNYCYYYYGYYCSVTNCEVFSMCSGQSMNCTKTIIIYYLYNIWVFLSLFPVFCVKTCIGVLCLWYVHVRLWPRCRKTTPTQVWIQTTAF